MFRIRLIIMHYVQNPADNHAFRLIVMHYVQNPADSEQHGHLRGGGAEADQQAQRDHQELLGGPR